MKNTKKIIIIAKHGIKTDIFNMIPNQDAKFLSNIEIRDLSINNKHNFSPSKWMEKNNNNNNNKWAFKNKPRKEQKQIEQRDSPKVGVDDEISRTV